MILSGIATTKHNNDCNLKITCKHWDTSEDLWAFSSTPLHCDTWLQYIEFPCMVDSHFQTIIDMTFTTFGYGCIDLHRTLVLQQPASIPSIQKLSPVGTFQHRTNRPTLTRIQIRNPSDVSLLSPAQGRPGHGVSHTPALHKMWHKYQRQWFKLSPSSYERLIHLSWEYRFSKRLVMEWLEYPTFVNCIPIIP